MPDDASPSAESAADPASPPPAPAEVSAETAEAPVEQESAHTPVYEPIPEGQNGAISERQSEPAKPFPEDPRDASAPAQNPAQAARDLLTQARAKRLTLRQEHLDAIMSEIEKRDSLSNKDVKKMLDCSEASPTRYLAALVKSGKIVKKGKGRGVVYVKVS